MKYNPEIYHRRSIRLKGDEFVVMPNHIHGSLVLNDTPLPPRGTQPGSIAAIVQNFKSVSTRRINRMEGMTGRSIWQRNYYEHIIRKERALHTIRQYIAFNPATWSQDQLHPDRQMVIT